MKNQIEQNAQAPFQVKKIFSASYLFCALTISLFHSETFAQKLCRDFLAENPQFATQFLHEKDSKLHTTPAVEKVVSQHKRLTGTSLTTPTDKINQWLDHLTRISNRAEKGPHTESLVKEALYKQFVIKTSEVPESYYALQVKMARERGYGDITLDPEQKAQMAETVIQDQKKSLDKWIEYLISKDTQMYPMWLKYWMFTGMAKLSKYNAEDGSFGNRSKETVAPFAELNREALAYVADAVMKKLKKESLEQIKDPEFLKLLEGLNFGKLYGRTLSKLGVGEKGIFESNEGRWVVYPQGSDHLPLVKSIEGRNTGWCTAGESTAESQLAGGDFHVFYSLDRFNQATIPRVAIRMKGSEIAEIRGVGVEQNLDAQINESSVVSTKIKEFGDRATVYENKDRDMKYLTLIDNKNKLGEELSPDDLKFLYEINHKIRGFGFSRDPRVDEILKPRNKVNDLVVAYDHKYLRSEISTTKAKALNGKTKLHYGNLDLSELTSVDGMRLPEILNGSLKLNSLVTAKDLVLPRFISGDLNLFRLTSAEGVTFPTTVNGVLDLRGIKTGKGLKLPENLNGALDMGLLTSAVGFKFPKIMNGKLMLGSLKSAKGLKLPERTGGLYLNGLTSAKGLVLPKTVDGTLVLGVTSAEGLNLPEMIKESLHLHMLASAKGLKFPKEINGELWLGVTSAEGLILPKTIHKDLYLENLTSAKGLKLPKMNAGLHLKNLISARGLKLPNILNGNLNLFSLTSGDGLILPHTITGNLNLQNLTTADGLTFPEILKGKLNVFNLPPTERLKLPAGIVLSHL